MAFTGLARTGLPLLLAALLAPLRAPAQSLPLRLQQADWEPQITGGAAVEWAGDAVSLSAPAGRAGSASIRAKTRMAADFEVRVSYELLQWQGGPGVDLSLALAISTPDDAPAADKQLIRVGRMWTDAVDHNDARVLRGAQWRLRSSAIETAKKGRLRIIRRRGEVRASVEVEGGWETLQTFTMAARQEMDLLLTASNGADDAARKPAVAVRFMELRVEKLPDLPGGGAAGAAGPAGEAGAKDWVVCANDMGWLRVLSRARFSAPEAKSSEIFGGGQEEKLVKAELQGGFATRDDALKFLCGRITRVVMSYNPTLTPKEIVRATFGDKEYYLGLEGANDPEALRPADNYNPGAEIALLKTNGITPRAAYRKLWLVHATGHGTTDGPVKDDAWMTIPTEPVRDRKNPAVGLFEIADGLGGTFTYSCDKWEGPYRDNFGMARAMQRLAVPEVAIYPPANSYVRKLVAADIPEAPRDFGAEVLGLQPIVDRGDLCEWQVYLTGNVWLHIGTRTEFETPVKQRETLLAGPGDAVMKRESIPLGRRFVSYEDALQALVPQLTNIRTMQIPLANPAEILVGEVGGKKALLHLVRDPDAAVAAYSSYNLAAEMRLLAARGTAARRTFKPQWLVHATGHGTYSGPVKDDLWMMVTSEPKNGGVTVPDGMGGTFGYSVDQIAGPLADSPALARELKARGITAIGLAGEDRQVRADECDVADPAAAPQEPARILSIAPERGEAGETFYITFIATGMKQGYRLKFGPGITVTDETCLGKNPDGPGERWLATLVIDRGARFDAGQ